MERVTVSMNILLDCADSNVIKPKVNCEAEILKDLYSDNNRRQKTCTFPKKEVQK